MYRPKQNTAKLSSPTTATQLNNHNNIEDSEVPTKEKEENKKGGPRSAYDTPTQTTWRRVRNYYY